MARLLVKKSHVNVIRSLLHSSTKNQSASQYLSSSTNIDTPNRKTTLDVNRIKHNNDNIIITLTSQTLCYVCACFSVPFSPETGVIVLRTLVNLLLSTTCQALTQMSKTYLRNPSSKMCLSCVYTNRKKPGLSQCSSRG